ncbi:unnamed protein product [Macrosiphum euphorbiae]|uniref:Uncharacterized protein n=1 Tax=Macrosiphum euphorbiae TaxID=13131 RepID=A0AAV0VTI1_9HEMI|nr:unnamed protein product [Macrosiphum euphorbiae]
MNFRMSTLIYNISRGSGTTNDWQRYNFVDRYHSDFTDIIISRWQPTSIAGKSGCGTRRGSPLPLSRGILWSVKQQHQHRHQMIIDGEVFADKIMF